MENRKQGTEEIWGEEKSCCNVHGLWRFFFQVLFLLSWDSLVLLSSDSLVELSLDFQNTEWVWLTDGRPLSGPYYLASLYSISIIGSYLSKVGASTH